MIAVDLLKDHKFKQYIEQVNEVVKRCETLSFPDQRKICTEFHSANVYSEPVRRVEDLEITGQDENKIPLRLYIPKEEAHLPVMLYFHGGGWVYGSIAEADAVCRRLANAMNCVVASVEYRLAPESPFPKALEDCYAATEWMAKHAARFQGDPNTLIVCGESAGGNLAAAVALMARDKKGPRLTAQLLLNPVITSALQDEAYDQSPDRYFLTKI